MCCVFVEVKEVNYMFPQGCTQWKVLECLLIKMSHLEQKIGQTRKGKTGKAATARAGSRQAKGFSGELNPERKKPASAETVRNIPPNQKEL